MPGLAQRNEQYCNGSSPANGFWSKHRDEISYTQLQKFWNDLAPQARQELLRIDKQTLFEQARKNMYCSRCNGLLLEGFLQIVMYGKSLQQESSNSASSRNRIDEDDDEEDDDGDSRIVNGYRDEAQDPSVHPWGGLTTSRDGSLTLMDCYLYSKSLKGLQNVFDSARARERERELLYPDACGGGGRGWISQGIVGYGRGHGTRETCALHTARLSCDTLVDFWSALGEETRQSLLRMKEEDFIERLMYRFDSKRFCRDCRRNVIREFKELKELKRMRRETRCTSWFCAADTAFQYEVSDDAIYADWNNAFADAAGTYCHFEWGVGTGEGKSDILEFENVGMTGSVSVENLDLGDLSACFITLRAWKIDGRCTELYVKAHALKSGQCVHSRLVVGDGFVTITRGESIRRFFEHAEEAEEEEDDDSMDKDGNDMDGECSRPQKHAKSPELAREFLLDAATVIFKEQVEKAFREGTARQNAHSIFVCLALKLLEERVHVACKEIITLEKQVKLLEEEEKEKREEEERKERRKTKEREKKLRRKERLKGKEKDKDSCESNQLSLPDVVEEEESVVVEVDEEKISVCDSVGDDADSVPLSHSPEPKEDSSHDCNDGATKDENRYYTVQYSRRRPKGVPLDTFQKWSERRRNSVADENSSPQNRGEINCSDRQSRLNGTKTNGRCNSKSGEKLNCSGNGRSGERYDYSCSCNHTTEYRPKLEPNNVSGNKSESLSDIPKQTRPNQTDQNRDNNFGRPKTKVAPVILQHPKKAWEPMEQKNKYPRSNSESDVTQSALDPNRNVSKNSASSVVKDPFTSKEEQKKDAISAPTTASIISSSSDNCSSSCLSDEGDSNAASSNLEINDSSSTSDSEDSSLQRKEKTTSPIRKDSPAPEIKSPPANLKTPAMNGFSAAPAVSQQNPVFQNLPPFPVFQAPPYYHQNPVFPANGILPFSHPSPYLYSGPQFGYNPVQHVAHHHPLYTPNPLPYYQQVSKPSREEVTDRKSPTIPIGESTGEGFSLFHFGGPVALSTGCQAPIPPKDEIVGDFAEEDGCRKGAKNNNGVEEYNLFAASNGIRFSFF